jgi:hypothetical protein
MSRNSRRTTGNIKQNDFETLFKNRDTTNANIYLEPFITYPDPSIRRVLNYEEHFWAAGDKYFKLSYKYYGSQNDWWIIARFNGKPTDADLKIGDRLVIPFPLDIVKDTMMYYNDY